MKNVTLLLFAIFLLGCENTNINRNIDKEIAEGNKEVWTYKNGVKHGIHKAYYETGQEMIKEMYLYGKESGYAYWYYRDGTIAVKRKYNFGVLEEVETSGDLFKKEVDFKEYKILEAVAENNFDKVKTLIKNGHNVDEMNEQGYTPLILAIKRGYLNIVELLIEKGANPNLFSERDILVMGSQGELMIMDTINLSPLMVAVIAGNSKIVEVLLNNKSKVEVVTEDEKNVFDYALEAGNKEIVRYILERTEVD